MELTKTFNNKRKMTELIKLARTNKYSAPKLSKIFNCDRKSVHRALNNNKITLKNLGIFKKSVYCYEDFFNNLNATSAYWTGFIAADGTLSLRGYALIIALNKADSKHLEKFKKAIKTNAKIGFTKSNNSTHIYIYSQELFKSLLKRGITPNKSLTINKVEVPDKLMSHFIRGVFDGDGSISGKDASHIQFMIAGNKPFLEQIQTFLIKRIGIKKTKIYHLTQSKAYKLQYTGIQIFKIFNFIYNDSIEDSRLARKYQKYIYFKDKFLIGENLK